MQDLTFQQMSLKMKRKEEVLGMKYEIKGDTLPVVVCYLEGGEQMITERGSMSWMSPNMKMETTTNGGIGKAFGRMFSGEGVFNTVVTGPGRVWLQTMPISNVAGEILKFMPSGK